MRAVLRRCWRAWQVFLVFSIIGLWLAWKYIRHGEDAFHEALGDMVLNAMREP